MVTLADLARAAGCSTSTVSRALSGNPMIPSGTQDRIIKLAQEMDYRGSAMRHRLRPQRTIGLVVPSIRHANYYEDVSLLHDVLSDEGYRIILACHHHDPELDQQIVRSLIDHPIDGLIHVPCSPAGVEGYLGGATTFPVVELGVRSKSRHVDAVVIDERQGIRELVGHLLHLGHRRIAFLTGRQDLHLIQRRTRSFRNEIAKAGLSLRECPVVFGPASPPWFRQATLKLLNTADAPTALILGNRQIAVGSLMAFDEAGMRVPGQVSVAALTDEDFYSVSRPPLTSFDYPFREMGMMAAQLLLERLNPEADPDVEPRAVEFTGQLLRRRSTAPARTTSRRAAITT
jgi:LacI family transcriptional regulator